MTALLDQQTTVQWGDTDAGVLFNRLYEQHAEPIAQYLRRFAMGARCREEMADDWAQDVWLKVWNALPGWMDNASTTGQPARYKALIYTVAKNWGLDRIHRHRLVEFEPLQFVNGTDKPFQGASPEMAYGRAASLYPTTFDPVACYEMTEMQREVRQVLDTLPIRQRALFVLREWAGLSYDEIGAVLHLSRRTVRSLLFRGRAAYAKALLARDDCAGLRDALAEAGWGTPPARRIKGTKHRSTREMSVRTPIPYQELMGARLMTLRADRGWSTRIAGLTLGISAAAWSCCESGKTRGTHPDRLARIAAGFGWTPELGGWDAMILSHGMTPDVANVATP